jgi:hypothetical protein
MKRVIHVLSFAAALLSLSAAQAQDEFVKCPLAEIDVAVTTQLPTGWWSTPQDGGPLVGTEVAKMAGRAVLVCRYRAFGAAIPITGEIPTRFSSCRAASGGFRCAPHARSSAGAAERALTPATQAVSNAELPTSTSDDVKLTVDHARVDAPTRQPDVGAQVRNPKVVEATQIGGKSHRPAGSR